MLFFIYYTKENQNYQIELEKREIRPFSYRDISFRENYYDQHPTLAKKLFKFDHMIGQPFYFLS